MGNWWYLEKLFRVQTLVPDERIINSARLIDPYLEWKLLRNVRSRLYLVYTLFTIRSLSFFSFYIAFFFYFYTSVPLTPLYASDTRVVTRVSRARTCWFIIVLDIILIRCKLLGCIMYVAIYSPRYLLSSSLASFCSPDEARILIGTWNISGNRFRIIKEVRILICIFFPSISLSINLIIISRRLLQFFFIFNCLYNNFSENCLNDSSYKFGETI